MAIQNTGTQNAQEIMKGYHTYTEKGEYKQIPAPGQPIEYPKHLYHLTQGSRVVGCKEDEDNLGEGWQEKPFPAQEK